MLIGFADSEGATNENNTLWDFSIVFKYVKKAKTTEIFHVTNFTHSKHAGDVIKPLKSFEKSIQYLLKYYNTEKLILIFWNASHDVNVLKRAGFSLPFTALCLMKYHGKQKLGGDHSALGDVNKMLEFKTDINDLLKKQYYSELDPFTELAEQFKKSVQITDVNKVKKKTLLEQAIEKSLEHKEKNDVNI